jgi:N-acetylglucosamine malate deacetylase 1
LSVMIVVAHPDDEVLGCGGIAAKLTSQGIEVTACILVGGAGERSHRPSDEQLHSDTLNAQQLLGMTYPILGAFPNIRLNTIAHVEMVQFVENAIIDKQPSTIITHHPEDLNDDHVHVSRAAQVACRLFQRRNDVKPLDALYFMEVLSATDWGLSANNRFKPTTYVGIESHLNLKLKALAAYRGVIRPYPHPRSEENVKALATVRGAEAGLRYAEALQLAFQRVSEDSRNFFS